MTIHRLALEEISEQRNVLTTVSQGRDDERWSGDAVVEVLTESPLAHPTIEILVGGRNDSNIHVLRLRGPDRPDLLVLEKPEQLDLQIQTTTHLMPCRIGSRGMMKFTKIYQHRRQECRLLNK